MESRPEITQAATEGNIEKIKLLLSKGANPNLKDEDERIPLHWAASAGRLEAVELFASLSNVAINSQDDAGWTPLMTAASAGHIDVVSFLLSKGADANIENENGQIPLHYHRGRVEIAEVLLDYTRDVNKADHVGSTPLSRALGATVSKEIIALLIDHGAKLNTRDIGGNTPLHLALMEGNEDIALYLVEQGADLKAMNSEKIRCLDLAKPAFLTQVQARMERP